MIHIQVNPHPNVPKHRIKGEFFISFTGDTVLDILPFLFPLAAANVIKTMMAPVFSR
jgi:hypothetical protein